MNRAATIRATGNLLSHRRTADDLRRSRSMAREVTALQQHCDAVYALHRRFRDLCIRPRVAPISRRTYAPQTCVWRVVNC